MVNTSKSDNHDGKQLNNHSSKICEKKDLLHREHSNIKNALETVRIKYKKYGNSKDTLEINKIRLRKYSIELKMIRKEIDRRKKTKADRNYSETSFLDSDTDYKEVDFNVVKNYGTKDNLLYFINDFVSERGEVSKSSTKEQKIITSKFLKSYLSISDGDGVRPLLNNRYGFELLKDTTFGKGGNIKMGGLTIALSYCGVNVREINTSKKLRKRLNKNTKKEKQFTALAGRIFNYNNKAIKEVSKETKTDPAKKIIDNNNTIAELVDGNSMGENIKTKVPSKLTKKTVMVKLHCAPPTSKIAGEILDFLFADNKDILHLPPKYVESEIVNNSLSKIHSFLHSLSEEIELLDLTVQELYEFTRVLSPKGDSDTKIEALKIVADTYRLRALREAKPRKKRLYRNIQEAAELKADLIFVVEKDFPLKKPKATSIPPQKIVINPVTTIVISARYVVKSFSQFIYKIFKDIAGLCN